MKKHVYSLLAQEEAIKKIWQTTHTEVLHSSSYRRVSCVLWRSGTRCLRSSRGNMEDRQEPVSEAETPYSCPALPERWGLQLPAWGREVPPVCHAELCVWGLWRMLVWVCGGEDTEWRKGELKLWWIKVSKKTDLTWKFSVVECCMCCV